MNDDSLKLASGITISQLKRDARKKSSREGIPYNHALNQLALQHAGETYDIALRRARAAAPAVTTAASTFEPSTRLDDDANELRCAVCGEGSGHARLLPVGNGFRPTEFVHRSCALDSEGEFGFCMVCPDNVVHRAESLHVHGEYVECEEHRGEFSSVTPEEEAGLTDLAEYWMNHPPEQGE